MTLLKFEHVWNTSKLYKDDINQMPESPREFRRPISLSHAALHDRLNPS